MLASGLARNSFHTADPVHSGWIQEASAAVEETNAHVAALLFPESMASQDLGKNRGLSVRKDSIDHGGTAPALRYVLSSSGEYL